MNKYISLALATAAAIACSKVAPEDISPIESLPQDENTENIYGEPSGEKIIISLAQTKVSLDGEGNYQFDGGEEIYVKAASTGAVATLRNSESDKNVFTGEFDNVIGKDSETFDFYFNCKEDTKVQNGQPWLSAKGISGTRKAGTEYSYELSDVQLKQLDGFVCLAINSSYPCSVDFHTLGTTLPTGETTISGIEFASENNKPYFVNIASGMTGGFYLTVTNTEGQKMYTSYGTSATITSNQIINTKAFEAFSGVSNLKITGFETTYSYYMDGDSATDPNGKVNSWMNGGTVTFSLSGISSSLVDVKFNNGDDDVTGNLEKSGSSFKYTFGSTENHTTFGAKTLTATVSFKAGIEPGAATETTTVRHITGLPFNCDDFSNESENWTKSTIAITFKTAGIYFFQATSASPYCTLKQYIHAPENVSVSMNAEFYKESKTIGFNKATLALTLGSLTISTAKTTTQTLSTEGIINGNSELKGSFSYGGANYTAEARIGKIHILYK